MATGRFINGSGPKHGVRADFIGVPRKFRHVILLSRAMAFVWHTAFKSSPWLLDNFLLKIVVPEVCRVEKLSRFCEQDNIRPLVTHNPPITNSVLSTIYRWGCPSPRHPDPLRSSPLRCSQLGLRAWKKLTLAVWCWGVNWAKESLVLCWWEPGLTKKAKK